jgi:hypothetical protein
MRRRRGALALAVAAVALLVLPASGGAQAEEDSTGPTITCGTSDGIWHAEDVAINCNASDLESGLVNATDATFSLSTAVATGSETDNGATDTRLVCDVAANCVTAGPIAGNKVDKALPANPALSLSHQAGRWSRDRTIQTNFLDGGSDAGSGVNGFSYSWTHWPGSVPDAQKDAEESAAGTISPSLTNGRWYFHMRTRDAVGNWSPVLHRGPFYIDGTPPRVAARSASGKVNNSIRLRYQTSDNTGKTRERLTISRNGNLIRSWSRSMAKATWYTVQSVYWSPSRAGSYRFCARAWDRAVNTRRDCETVSVTRPASSGGGSCHPSYVGACLNPAVSDYDCAGGS